MESIYLRTLVEVARTGSITRAAEALAVTQSAASRRIRFVEERYGKQLLDRSGPTLTLTDAGRIVVEKAKEILEVERELLSTLHVMDEKAPGLSFACTPTFGIVHLPEIVREFILQQSEVGDLRFVLDVPDRIIAGLDGGRYDAAVIEHCEPLALSGFEKVSLPGDEMVFAASPALRIGGPEVELDLILSHTLYTRPEGCCSPMRLRANLGKLGRGMSEFRRVVVYDDVHVIVRAVIHGEGVAFLSTDLLAPHVKAGRLRVHRVVGFEHARNRTLVRCEGPGEDCAAAFVRQLLARMLAPGSPSPAT